MKVREEDNAASESPLPLTPCAQTRVRKRAGSLLLCSVALTLALGALLWYWKHDSPYRWDLPLSWDPPPVPPQNPMSKAKVMLGRYLFYDRRLSHPQTHSCATCHKQHRAFTDGRKSAVGATGKLHPRNTMSLTNVGYKRRLTWGNPLLHSLEGQALIPLFGEFPVEMNMVGKRKILLSRLRKVGLYRRLFSKAFPDQKPALSLAHVVQALAAFQRTLISSHSRYDQYKQGKKDALTREEKQGMQLFFSQKLSCFRCHGGRHFDTSVNANRKPQRNRLFHNTNLYNIDRQGQYPRGNTGIHEVTWKKKDMGHFKTPTLRNIALTAPYMHDGSVPSLEQVIEHYAAGGRAQIQSPVGTRNPYTSPLVRGFAISASEKKALIRFLHSLTDFRFVTNPMFKNPWLR